MKDASFRNKSKIRSRSNIIFKMIRNYFFIFVLTAVVLSLSACGVKSGSGANASNGYDGGEYEAAEAYGGNKAGGMAPQAAADTAYASDQLISKSSLYREDLAEVPSAPVNQNPDIASGRKLIRQVGLSLETMELPVCLQKIQAHISGLGGYIEYMNVYSDRTDYPITYDSASYYYRDGKSYQKTGKYAALTVRIPAQNMDSFLNFVTGEANVVSRNESVSDVTLQYVDTQSRKKSLVMERDKIYELLEKAADLNQIIQLESRIQELNYQIENMESSLRVYDNQVEYSTVTIDLSEVTEYTPPQDMSRIDRMFLEFRDNLKDVGYAFIDLGFGLVVRLPFILLAMVGIAVVIIVIRLLFKKAFKGAKKKKDVASKDMEEK